MSSRSVSRRQWKIRLANMRDASGRIVEYCKNLKSEESFATDRKTLDACMRNFQILGDAAKEIPVPIQKEMDSIPWKKIRGMRNILVHEYFAVSSKILWNTVMRDIPKLHTTLATLSAKLQEPLHPWRICPPGETYVRSANIRSHLRDGHPVREHLRHEHCRESHETIRNVLAVSELEDIVELFFSNLKKPPSANTLDMGAKAKKYDALIGGWVQYWNDVLRPEEPLDPNVVKALIASESSFEEKSGIKKRNSAKGLMQLKPATIRYLNGEQGELKDHIFEFESKDAFNPNLNIAAGVRWLFRKKETATARLGRPANWDESVQEYKDYLRRVLKNPSTKMKGMEIYRGYLKTLNGR